MTDAPNPDTKATDPKVTTPETTTPEATDADSTLADTKADPQPAATPVKETATEPTTTPTTAPATAKKKTGGGATYIWGTGRRKRAVARVRIRPGDGQFVINKRKVNEYFKLDKDRQSIVTPLEVTNTTTSMDVAVNVAGGGLTGQAGAILLGVARALLKADPAHGVKLKEHNLLTRDPRKVERKKYGQRGARRRFQFSKR